MSKKINIISFLIFSLFIVLVVSTQSSLQHWIGQWDLDFWYIYNASLMASGIEQEWYDHPATTFLSLYSFFYKVYSLFDPSFVYKINEIMDSSDINLVLQKLYFVTRIFNSISLISIIFFTFKICKILSLKDIYRYFFILSFILSLTFADNISILTAEAWSILFFLISFYYFLRFFIENKIIFIILSGIFFLFSFYSKLSILFIFIFIVPLIPVFFEIYSTKNDSPILQSLEKNFQKLFGGYLALLLFYLLIQIFVLSKISLLEKNAGLDVLIIFILNFSYMVFFLIFSKFNINKFKTYFSIFLLFLAGLFLGLLIFIILHFLNIITLNPWLIFHFTNPFNEMLQFVTSVNSSVSSTNLLNSMLNNLLRVFSNFHFDKFLFVGLFIIFLISIFKDLKIGANNYFLLKLILFTCLLINILILNFRFYTQYLIFHHIIYIIVLSICFGNISNKIKNTFCVILFIYCMYYPIENFNRFKGFLKTRVNYTLEHQCNKNSQFRVYAKQFTEETIKKLCN